MNANSSPIRERMVYSPDRPTSSMLAIILEIVHGTNNAVAPVFVTALREYADAIERGNDGEFYKDKTNRTPESNPPVCGQRDIEKMVASNGCVVKVISGIHEFARNDENHAA